jgi:hypothetical protein
MSVVMSRKPSFVDCCPRLHAARAAFAKVRHDRELFEAAGIGPGDSYLALWSHLIELRNQWHNNHAEADRRYYAERYAEVLRWLLPYERPKLQVVKVKTEPGTPQLAPEEMARSLAKALTPEELELLDKVALKLVAPPAIEGKAEPEAGGSRPSEAQPFRQPEPAPRKRPKRR